ncbi:unnamed protein product [Amoebophrya sp. A120]|nr:unnamed protein product [Amoebophrya sp. A120]|eukprot:GSA120T00026021001.1
MMQGSACSTRKAKRRMAPLGTFQNVLCDPPEETPLLSEWTVAEVVKAAPIFDDSKRGTTLFPRNNRGPRIVVTYYAGSSEAKKKAYRELRGRLLGTGSEETAQLADSVFSFQDEFVGGYSSSTDLSKVMDGQVKKFQNFIPKQVGTSTPLFRSSFTFTGVPRNEVYTILEENCERWERRVEHAKTLMSSSSSAGEKTSSAPHSAFYADNHAKVGADFEFVKAADLYQQAGAFPSSARPVPEEQAWWEKLWQLLMLASSGAQKPPMKGRAVNLVTVDFLGSTLWRSKYGQRQSIVEMLKASNVERIESTAQQQALRTSTNKRKATGRASTSSQSRRRKRQRRAGQFAAQDPVADGLADRVLPVPAQLVQPGKESGLVETEMNGEPKKRGQNRSYTNTRLMRDHQAHGDTANVGGPENCRASGALVDDEAVNSLSKRLQGLSLDTHHQTRHRSRSRPRHIRNPYVPQSSKVAAVLEGDHFSDWEMI